MARFVGRQGKGRMKAYRAQKRIDAELRTEEYQASLKETKAILADKDAVAAIAEGEESKDA
jgi:hypothetical protein